MREKIAQKKNLLSRKTKLNENILTFFALLPKFVLFVFDYCKMNFTAFISWCHKNRSDDDDDNGNNNNPKPEEQGACILNTLSRSCPYSLCNFCQ